MLYQKEVISSLDMMQDGTNWWVKILIYVGVFLISGFLIYLKEKSIKRCLVWACSEAERMLGSKTGRLKLKMVYDTFVNSYPIISTFVPFKLFCEWIDIALDELKAMIESNENIRGYIERGEVQ